MEHYENGEPCNHPGCANHVTHPCEVCGRVMCIGEANIKKVLLNTVDWINNVNAKHYADES